MPLVVQPIVSEEEFDRAEQEFFRAETLEDMSESEWSFIQRLITVEAFNLLKLWHFPSLYFCGEMLVMERVAGRMVRVVPDNFVSLDGPGNVKSSYRLNASRRLFWVLEYVSESTPNKDYKESFQKYEKQLRVPYCTMFEPISKDLQMHHHNGVTYDQMQPDALGRYFIPELELKVGLQNGWLRFWHREELLPSPQELGTAHQEQAEGLKAAERAIAEKDQELTEIRQRELNRVVKLATAAGRMEIVNQAPDASLEQLQNWMDELLG